MISPSPCSLNRWEKCAYARISRFYEPCLECLWLDCTRSVRKNTFMPNRLLIVGPTLILMLLSAVAFAAPELPQKTGEVPTAAPISVAKFCYDRLSSLPGKFDKEALKEICSSVTVLDSCQ